MTAKRSKPPTPDVPPREDFVWPPTTDELDSIEVIMLQPRSDDEPQTLPRRHDRRPREFRLPRLRVPRIRVPQVHVPRVAMPRVSVSRVRVPGASGFIAAVMFARASRPDRPNRVGVVHWGLTLTCLLAIVVALASPVSEWGRTRTSEAADLAAMIERAAPTADQTPPEDVRAAEPAFAPPSLPHASPATFTETPVAMPVADDARPVRAAMRRTTPAMPRTAPVMRLLDRVDRDKAPWWGRTRATLASRSSSSRRATAVGTGVVSAPLRLPESYVQPRVVSSGDGGRVRGKVVLGVQVRSNGRVGEVDVLSRDVDRDLERAAIAAVKQWRYRPALRDGVPTPARVKVVVNFG